MKVFILMSCLALATARPEAGYSYNAPQRGFTSLTSVGGGNGFNVGGFTENVGGFVGTSGGGGSQVHKHVYIHVAPDEDIASVSRDTPIQAVTAQKHYKIIFIKAPSYNQQIAQQQQAVAQAAAQEKTLVYVLSRKPDALSVGGATAAAAAEFKPSKPKVYFIKYKAQTGASTGSTIATGGPGIADTGFVGVSGTGAAVGVPVPAAHYGPSL